MNALELADKLQSHASSQYGELCGSLWDAGAMLRNLHTENTALRCTEMALRDEIESLRQLLAARVLNGVNVPLDVLEAASDSLGAFYSDLGWTDIDMQAMGNLDAYIARHKAMLSAAPAQPEQADLIEVLCARIKAADDAAAEGDYMLDSDDCIKVIRGEWTGPMLNDKPAKDIGVEQDERVFARIEAMKARKSAQPEPAAHGEPVAWSPSLDYPQYEKQRVWANGKPRQEDIDYWSTHGNGIDYAYANPQQASKPMTEHEIWESDAIMEVNAEAQIAFENIVRFVRAVERFHKIGGE